MTRPATPSVPEQPRPVQGHWSLDRSARHAGAVLDCGVCRADLLEAFRAPADAPGAPPVLDPFNRAPGLETALHRLETGACLEPGLCSADDPCLACTTESPEPGLAPVHDVDISVMPPPPLPLHASIHPGLGSWAVVCATCGWRQSGLYGARQTLAADGVQARRLAETWAAHHRNNPTREN